MQEVTKNCNKEFYFINCKLTNWTEKEIIEEYESIKSDTEDEYDDEIAIKGSKKGIL